MPPKPEAPAIFMPLRAITAWRYSVRKRRIAASWWPGARKQETMRRGGRAGGVPPARDAESETST